MRHTPGPWRAYTGEVRPQMMYRRNICILEESGERFMAVAADHHVDQVTEHEANAHLIAAAPDLLEACEEALQRLGGRFQAEDMQAGRTLRAALAKARGESE